MVGQEVLGGRWKVIASCCGACSKKAGPTFTCGLVIVRHMPGIRATVQAMSDAVSSAPMARSQTEVKIVNTWSRSMMSVQPPKRGRTPASQSAARLRVVHDAAGPG